MPGTTTNADYLQQLQDVAALLQARDRYLLACHVDPDPDCIGSMLALDWALRKLGKSCVPVSPDPLLPQWRFFPGQERVRLPHQVNADEWDILVVVDCQVDRTGAVAAWADKAETIINIDHHVTNPGAEAHMLLNSDAAAAAEIVYDLIAQMGLPANQDIAVLLYAALMADTGAFRFSNTNARVLRLAADLVDLGASPAIISREIYDTRSWGYLQLMRRVLGTLERSADGLLACITLHAHDIVDLGVRKDESEGLIQFPRMIDGVEVAVLFREVEQNEVRISLRSRSVIDVSRLAQVFGGGGHARAAGCTIHHPLPVARQMLLDEVDALTRDLSTSAAGEPKESSRC